MVTLYFTNQAAPNLVATNTTTGSTFGAYDPTGARVVYVHQRTYKVSSGGVETELTSGWTACGSKGSNGNVEVDTAWTCPATAFNAGDYVRVKLRVSVGAEVAYQQWDSLPDRGDLLAQVWTFHIWIYRLYLAGIGTVGDCYFGSSTFPSRIENVGYGSVTVTRTLICDGLTLIS